MYCQDDEEVIEDLLDAIWHYPFFSTPGTTCPARCLSWGTSPSPMTPYRLW
jgi:hypothetical protein